MNNQENRSKLDSPEIEIDEQEFIESVAFLAKKFPNAFSKVSCENASDFAELKTIGSVLPSEESASTTRDINQVKQK